LKSTDFLEVFEARLLRTVILSDVVLGKTSGMLCCPNRNVNISVFVVYEVLQPYHSVSVSLALVGNVKLEDNW
jgi:hypothetical protein